MANLDAMTVKVKIDPEMSDEAKAILREMIVTELQKVFPDTIKPLELLLEQVRGEIHEMVKEEIEAYFQNQVIGKIRQSAFLHEVPGSKNAV